MKINKKAKLSALIPIMFFSVSGGPYGLEEIVVSVGPLNTLLLILIIPIIWTIPESMIVAELSSNYPVQGGYYKWVQMSMGRFWGFMEGWWSILYTLIDLSLYPILFTAYLKFFFPNLNFWELYFIQLLVIWISASLNILGIRIVGYTLFLFTVFILFSFLIFIVLGLKFISFDISPIFNSHETFTVNNFLFGLSLAFWNFIGWDNPSTALEEMDNPNHNYRKAMFFSIPIIIIFYFFPLLVGLSINTNWHNWKFGEFSYIAQTMNLPWLAVILSIGGMVMCVGLFNSLLLSSTRIFSTMSNDNLLPKAFSKIHKKYHTPHISIIFAALMYSILVLVSFHNLVIYDVFLYLIAISLEAIALVILRKKYPHENNSFKIPFGNTGMYFIVGMLFVSIIFVALANITCCGSFISGGCIGLLLLLSGIPAYKFIFNRN